tara:strand:- start:3356 stop:3646 length:291 start_codon:yes stop_codon:yes gene_type:complete
MEKDELLEEALDNARDDRIITKNLLTALSSEISSSATNHARSGIVAAKYVETLQRSNEQLIKIIAIIKKQQTQKEDLSLSGTEKDTIFELIKESAS